MKLYAIMESTDKRTGLRIFLGTITAMVTIRKTTVTIRKTTELLDN